MEVAIIRKDFVDGKVTLEEFQRFMGSATPHVAIIPDLSRVGACSDKVDAIVEKGNPVRDSLDAHTTWAWGVFVIVMFIYPAVTIVMLLVYKFGVQWIAVLANMIIYPAGTIVTLLVCKYGIQ